MKNNFTVLRNTFQIRSIFLKEDILVRPSPSEGQVTHMVLYHHVSFSCIFGYRNFEKRRVRRHTHSKNEQTYSYRPITHTHSSRRRSDLTYFDLQNNPGFPGWCLRDKDFVSSREEFFENLGLRWKLVWMSRGLPWKIVWIFGSRIYLKSVLLRPWYWQRQHTQYALKVIFLSKLW